MTNAIAPIDTIDQALAGFGSFDDLAKQVAETETQARQKMAEAPGGVMYAKFAKHGTQGPVSPWQYGREDETRQIRPDSVWLVDPATLMRGFGGFKKTNGTTGDLVTGQKPDLILAPWFEAFPERDPALPWADSITYQFRAICAEEGAPPLDKDGKLIDEPVEALGDVIEVTVSQKMQVGFMDLEKALRARVAAIHRAKAGGNMAQAAELAGAMYPRVRLTAKIGVKVKAYLNNKPILEHIGWSNPTVSMDAPEAAPETPPELDLTEVIAQAQVEAPAPKAARRRSK